MRLTGEEKSILDGNQGEAARIALSVLVDLGELFGANELMTVSQVHIDATLYMVDAGLEFAEKNDRSGRRSSSSHFSQSQPFFRGAFYTNSTAKDWKAKIEHLI